MSTRSNAIVKVATTFGVTDLIAAAAVDELVPGIIAGLAEEMDDGGSEDLYPQARYWTKVRRDAVSDLVVAWETQRHQA